MERKKAMANIILITGGAECGKSRWAATYFSSCNNVLYMRVQPEMNKETAERIRWNCEKNCVEWDIRTSFSILDEGIKDHEYFIFDNIASYTSKMMSELCPDAEHMDDDMKHKIRKKIIDDISELIMKVKEADGKMIVITVETGFSVIPENKVQVAFREILGAVNQRIANMCSDVYMSASGIQFRIK